MIHYRGNRKQKGYRYQNTRSASPLIPILIIIGILLAAFFIFRASGVGGLNESNFANQRNAKLRNEVQYAMAATNKLSRLGASSTTIELAKIRQYVHGMELINELNIITPDEYTPVRKLSGGNIQKVLVGREIAAAPSVFMAAYPVRGLDINASYGIYNMLNKQKEQGVAVIFVGEDLDVLLELCDRILVLCGGQVSGIVDARSTTKEEIGLLMTKSDSDIKEVADHE